MERPVETLKNEDADKKTPYDDLDREELLKKCKGLLAIAQKAKISKTELKNELEGFKLKLEEAETEKTICDKKLKTLQELVDSLTEQKLRYITDIDMAHGKIKAISNKYKSCEDEVLKQKQLLTVKDEKINDLSLKYSNLDTESISLKRQNNRLVEENEQLISQLRELEVKIEEFNRIGLEQHQQLCKIEEQVNSAKTESESENPNETKGLHKKLAEMELQIKSNNCVISEYKEKYAENDEKLKEITQLYENEKDNKNRANIKLRAYKDKITKCASCINQLKNDRFILKKTVKEYSEHIPKWQTEIIKASKFLDTQLNELNSENKLLKEKLKALEIKINEFACPKNNEKSEEKSAVEQELQTTLSKNDDLQNQIKDLQQRYDTIKCNELQKLLNENVNLMAQLNNMSEMVNSLTYSKSELEKKVDHLKCENNEMAKSLNNVENNPQQKLKFEELGFQIKSLENEKAILVKEKMNAKDCILELENQNKILHENASRLNAALQCATLQVETAQKERNTIGLDKQVEVNKLKSELMEVGERYKSLKKEYDNISDLNGLLKEEVDTLKLSLEQPQNDTDNLAEVNESLQADIVKLESKLSNYKQENSVLLSDMKEMRARSKEADAILSEYEEAKAKLENYKTENSELLHEMKDINQVLKERGESITKLQKALNEMERLVEALEKDRENINSEKNELSLKITALEVDLKNSESCISSENIDKIVSERDNALKQLVEKDAAISMLREDVEKLKHSNPAVEMTNDDMSTSTISKAEDHARMKDLDESFEERYTKLRLFALKLKKKLNETTKQLQESEQDKARLEKLLNDSKTDTEPSEQDHVDGCESVDGKTDIKSMEAKLKTLTTELESSKSIADELEKVKAELSASEARRAAEAEAHRGAREALDKARREVKKKSVLSLEMEDYERSMKDLTAKMEDNKKKMIQLESTIDTQEGTISAMKTQIKLLEEQIKTEETQNRLVKEELHRVIEDGREKDNVIQTKNEHISKLELDIEDEKRKYEENTLEMTSLLGEKEKAVMSLGEEKTELGNKLKRIEFKCADLEEKLKITNIELEDLKTEHASYKVRAQAVLRQNQTVDHSQEEQLKEEAAALRARVDALEAKLSAAVEKSTELQAASELERRRGGAAAAEAARAAQRSLRLQADLARLAAQLDAERDQHKLQVSTLTQCYKSQLSDLEGRLQLEAEQLRRQLAARDATPAAPAPRDDSEPEPEPGAAMPPREEGEGSEAAPSPPPSAASAGGGRSPVPLERLLEQGVPDDDDAAGLRALGLPPDQELVEVKAKLAATQQRVKHVTALLAESEREGARLAALGELLKAEVRRARHSLERSQHAHNAEYMKNVTLKFLTLGPGDERARLVPVLQKILTLTPDETQKIQAVAKGQDPNANKGWGSYLPWPGAK